MLSFFPHLHAWFYRPFSAKTAAVFRIATGTVLFLSFLLAAPYVRPFFSNEGYVSKEYVSTIANPGTLSIFFSYDAYWFVLAAFVALMLSLILYIAGIAARWNAIIIYVLALSFYNRFPLISFDGNALMITMFMFAIFLDSDRAYSPRWWQQKRDALNASFAKTSLGKCIATTLALPQPKDKDMVAGWPARLIQINFALVYLFAGFAKIRADAWYVQGTEAGRVLQFQYATANFTFLDSFPLIMALMTWGTILLELAFPFLVWFKETRRFALFGLVIIHGSSMVTLNVSYFAETMLAIATIFLLTEDIEAISTWKRTVWKFATSRVTIPSRKSRHA